MKRSLGREAHSQLRVVRLAWGLLRNQPHRPSLSSQRRKVVDCVWEIPLSTSILIPPNSHKPSSSRNNALAQRAGYEAIPWMRGTLPAKGSAAGLGIASEPATLALPFLAKTEGGRSGLGNAIINVDADNTQLSQTTVFAK
ncbi:hypothetical protein QQ020_35640 [Fulvivirgaceae bacterium BMA12]|uniref:Uncharacterized protein n=1 Tax=Agaribacillus aureus TaxID=3051825 RepID=A0ABT8LL78_9BACT|nr:hypothetical protein [Fulvivirgaceae bacterium BMA12]